MPQKMLKKMLCSLCSDGAVFCRPMLKDTGLHRDPITGSAPNIQSAFSGFAQNILGGHEFNDGHKGKNPYYAPECHPNHVEIIFPVDGTVDFLINYEWKTLTFPKTHILFRNTQHTERHCGSQPYTLLWLTSLPRSLTLHRTAYSPETGYSQSACRIAIMPPMAKSLWDCGSAPHPDEVHYFSLFLQCIEFACTHDLAQQDTLDYRYTVIAQIKEFLNENFVNQISLDDLSQMAHCSAIHLNRLFFAQYHQTIHQYLMELRFTEAKRLLEAGLSPTETASRIGFEDSRYFSRFFRQRTGRSPSEYRRLKM